MRFRPAPVHLLMLAPVAVIALTLILRHGDSLTEEARKSPAPAEESPAQGAAALSPRVPSSLQSRKSHERDPFLEGRPLVIQQFIDQLDNPNLPAAEREKLILTLKEGIDGLIVQNGVYSLPLVSRIMTEAGLPLDLRKAALSTLGRLPNPQTADFLVRLAASGTIAADAQPETLRTMTAMIDRLHAVNQTKPLMALCKQVFEGSMLSSDAAVREAAVAGFGTLVPAGDPLAASQFLRGILGSDPSSEVRTAAAELLARNEEWVKDNEWLSGEMKAIVVSGAQESDRVNALNILVATQTPSARDIVLACLQDGSELMRKVAILDAGKLKLSEAVPGLAQMLADSKSVDPVVRKSYVLPALAEIPGIESTRAILTCAASDPDPEVRGLALAAAGQAQGVKDERLGRALVNLYESRTDAGEKAEAASLLARSASPEAYDSLRRSFISTAGDDRLDLASMILHSPHGGDFVQSTFSDLLKTRLGKDAVSVLITAAPDRALNEIQDFYVSRKGNGVDLDTRQITIHALGELGSARARVILAKIGEVEEDPNLRLEVKQTLKRISENE